MASTNQNASPPSPSPPPHARISDDNSGAFTVVISLLGLIFIPSLIFAFIFVLNCLHNPFRRRRRSSDRTAGESGAQSSCSSEVELVSEVKFFKEVLEKEQGGECPVCLSVFVQGEEIRQLNACKHSFHLACIDMWLYSHSNCPICRASVTVKGSKPSRAVVDREADLRQGLPDAASLV